MAKASIGGYNKDTNYSAEISAAVSSGDYVKAAVLQQERNNKIDGEGLSYEKSDSLSGYLDNENNVTGPSSSNSGYKSAYSDTVSGLLGKLSNYGTYDPTTDATYQKALATNTDYYTNLGKTAMSDTVGQVSARTGGLASSYATSAGAQAYNNYMQALDEKNLTLLDQGQSRFDSAKSDLYNLLSAYQGADNTDYSRYRDTVSDAQTAYQNKTAAQQYADSQAQQAYTNKFNETQYTDSRTDQNFSKASTLLQLGFSTADIASTLGITEEQANQYATVVQQTKLKALTSSSSSGSGGSSSSGKPTLTAAQTVAAIKAGTLTDTVLSAYKYYYGEDYTSSEFAPGNQDRPNGVWTNQQATSDFAQNALNNGADPMEVSAWIDQQVTDGNISSSDAYKIKSALTVK